MPDRHVGQVERVVGGQLEPPGPDQLGRPDRRSSRNELDELRPARRPRWSPRAPPASIAGRGQLTNQIASPSACRLEPEERPTPEDHVPRPRLDVRAGDPRVTPPKLVSPTYRPDGASGSMSRRVTEWMPSAPTSRSPTASDPSSKRATTRPSVGARPRRGDGRSRPAIPRRSASSRSRRLSVARLSVWATVPSGRGAPRPGRAQVGPPLASHSTFRRVGRPPVVARCRASDRGEGVEAVGGDREVGADVGVGRWHGPRRSSPGCRPAGGRGRSRNRRSRHRR